MENNPTNTKSQTATTIPRASTLLSPEEIAALRRVIDYLWKEELRHVQELLGTDHIVFDLIVLKDWMTNLHHDMDGHIPNR